MFKSLSMWLILVLALFLYSGSVYAEDDYIVIVNGQTVVMTAIILVPLTSL